MMLLPNNGSARLGASLLVIQQQRVFSRGELTIPGTRWWTPSWR